MLAVAGPAFSSWSKSALADWRLTRLHNTGSTCGDRLPKKALDIGYARVFKCPAVPEAPHQQSPDQCRASACEACEHFTNVRVPPVSALRL